MNRILLCLEVYHYAAQFITRGAKGGCFCECFISSAIPRVLSLIGSGQVDIQSESYFMKCCSHASLPPKSSTSIKPVFQAQCFEMSLLESLPAQLCLTCVSVTTSDGFSAQPSAAVGRLMGRVFSRITTSREVAQPLL